MFIAGAKRHHEGGTSQVRMHCFPQGAGAFAVDDAHFVDAARPALGEISREEFADIRGPEGVQIQLARDGKRHRILGRTG